MKNLQYSYNISSALPHTAHKQEKNLTLSVGEVPQEKLLLQNFILVTVLLGVKLFVVRNYSLPTALGVLKPIPGRPAAHGRFVSFFKDYRVLKNVLYR